MVMMLARRTLGGDGKRYAVRDIMAANAILSMTIGQVIIDCSTQNENNYNVLGFYILSDSIHLIQHDAFGESFETK